jgi:ATP-binding cassette, subfamily B, multidrug efflux pump
MHSHKDRGFMAQAFVTTYKAGKSPVVILLLALAAGSVLAVWPSVLLKQIIDVPLAQSGQGLLAYAFAYLGAVLLLGLCDWMREYASAVFGQRMLLQIRTQMLERLQFLPMSYYLEVPAGETISRFTADIDSINTLFTAGLVSAAADLLKIFGLTIAIFSLSPVLGWIALGALPVVYVLADYFRRNIYRRQKVVRSRVSDINSVIQEVYAGTRIIKAFGRERYIAEKFEPMLEKHRLAMNAGSVYDAWFPCVMQTLRAAVIALALIAGASNNLTPLALGLSLGTLAAAADLFTRFFDPIEAAASEIQTIQQAMAGVDRIKSFFDQPVDMADKTTTGPVTPDTADAVVVNEVRFAYKNGPDVLRAASMAIPAGSKAAIAGRTGSGKTTLMNLIAGLYPAKAGSIRVFGQDPFLLPPAVRRKLVGIVPQSIVLFSGTVADNVTLNDKSVSISQVEKALETVGLLHEMKRLPDGLNTKIGEGAGKLSFGQTQLLSLARAIVTDPPLLLLDELTAGLDALTERQVLDAIRNISQSRTILTISHRLSGIVDADAVHIMEHGRIMESGSPEKLAGREGWYALYKRLEDKGWQISG